MTLEATDQGVFKEMKESFHKYHLVHPFVFVRQKQSQVKLY